MVDCDYCSGSFDDEDSYLEHLAAEHQGELGSIDQRRVAQRTDEESGSFPLGPVVIGGIVLVTVVLLVYVTQLSGGGGAAADGVEGQQLSQSGDPALLADVESFPNQGNEHVDSVSQSTYDQFPPLSGPHYGGTVSAGFYEEEQSLGDLVHTLEHGAVIVYYDPAALSDNATESLREFSSVHTGAWRSVVVVPNPSDDPEAAYVLTAWQHRLYMDDYDAETVHAFLSEYLGRGPENSVR